MSTTLLDAKRRKETALASLKELTLKERQGSLVSRSAVEKEWFKIGRSIRDNLMNIPDRVSGQCASLRDQDKIHSLLTQEIRLCLEGLANGMPT